MKFINSFLVAGKRARSLVLVYKVFEVLFELNLLYMKAKVGSAYKLKFFDKIWALLGLHIKIVKVGRKNFLQPLNRAKKNKTGLKIFTRSVKLQKGNCFLYNLYRELELNILNLDKKTESVALKIKKEIELKIDVILQKYSKKKRSKNTFSKQHYIPEISHKIRKQKDRFRFRSKKLKRKVIAYLQKARKMVKKRYKVKLGIVSRKGWGRKVSSFVEKEMFFRKRCCRQL